MISPEAERNALWALFGLIVLAIVGACVVIVLIGLVLGEIAKWVFA